MANARNLMVVQGGGPTAVFNASLAGVIAEAQTRSRFGEIYGARSGMKGLPSGDVIPLSRLTPADLLSLGSSPGAALGSSRFKPTPEDLGRCVDVLRQMEVRYLLFMGGNGTMRGAQIVSDFCRTLGFEIQIIGVPKTIDNDIAATDRCPGFASAARFVAQSTVDLAVDLRSLPQPVSIFETLGRDVGWLAASSTLGKLDVDDAPHLVYVPEVAFSEERFLADLDRVVTRLGWAVVVVSEGILHADGTPVFEQRLPQRKDVQGVAVNRPLIGGVAQYLSGVVSEHLGIRCRSEKPGLIGRSCMAQMSSQDREDAELVGRAGVRALIAGATDEMIALTPLLQGSGPGTKRIALAEAAGAGRRIPAEWLTHAESAVSESFREYASPLVGELVFHPDVLPRL